MHTRSGTCQWQKGIQFVLLQQRLFSSVGLSPKRDAPEGEFEGEVPYSLPSSLCPKLQAMSKDASKGEGGRSLVLKAARPTGDGGCRSAAPNYPNSPKAKVVVATHPNGKAHKVVVSQNGNGICIIR